MPLQRCVVFELNLSGPRASHAVAAASLRSAGFTVRDIPSPYGPTDSDLWLVAEQAMRREPTAGDQDALTQRATDAAARYGFDLRMHAVVWALRDTTGGA